MYPFEDDKERVIMLDEDNMPEKEKEDQSEYSDNEESEDSHNDSELEKIQKERVYDDIPREEKMYN